MRTLLSLYPQRVYKMAYYRKQTKNHWARDDPGFCFLQIIMLLISSIAYGLAFRVSSISAILGFVAKSILINWLGFGVIMASVGTLLSNNHLNQASERSSNHVKQSVEWLYAFDVHCNAFVPLFVLLCKWCFICFCGYCDSTHTKNGSWYSLSYSLLTFHITDISLFTDGLQFFLLPLVLGTSLLSLGAANTLFAVAFGWYFYITHLGYRGERYVVFTLLVWKKHYYL